MEIFPALLPILPIRNTVLFPGVSLPLVVGRPRSLAALKAAEEGAGLILLVSQRLMTQGDPGTEDLNGVGTICKLESNTVAENGHRQVVVTGVARCRVLDVLLHPDQPDAAYKARGEVIPDSPVQDPIRVQALMNTLKTLAKEILELLPGATETVIQLVDRIDDAAYLSHVCASYLSLSQPQKQELLEETSVEKRMEKLLDAMQKERDVLSLQGEIRDKISERMNKAQREALLREQLRTIRTELGEDGGEEMGDDLEERLERAELPPEAARQAREEMRRFKGLPAASAESNVIRSYLEWLAVMPWKRSTQDRIDLQQARKILDEDHFGLEDVKKRILQFLAVAKMKNDLRGPILCLLGPPGVGKTSLGQSIARAIGRKFVRTSLGGVRDEAEIRGHRRTYVGALPGRIVQSLKRVGTRNPVMMLDEIDKLRADFHGDPSSAMLEVLDPEQNSTFTDHYLDVPFDLSDVFFIATANQIDTIPPPLRDRMEVIEVSGYTSMEKQEIAQRHLLPRELRNNGFKPEQVSVTADALQRLIHHHTREAGVRELSRKIGALLRASAQKLVEQGDLAQTIVIGSDQIPELIGPDRFFKEEVMREEIRPGIATGLAWTPHGGDILHIEATRVPGKGQLILTGSLGDVMKESAQIALSLARSSPELGILIDLSLWDIHIHVPSGAIPKDGPSAGVTLLAALVSLFRGRSLNGSIGMTGEITLRGAILPVGGIKEKVLAAHRAGLKTVILPKKNANDLESIPESVRAEVQFLLLENAEQLIHALFPAVPAPIRVPQPPLVGNAGAA